MVTIPEALQETVTTARLVDMLDFSRKEFNKAIDLTPKKTIIIESKWNVVKLGDVAEIIAGQSPLSEHYNELGDGLPFFQGKKDFGEIFLNRPVVWTTHITKEAIKNDLLMSVRAPVGDVNLNPFNKICIGRGLAAIRSKDISTQEYFYEFISANRDFFQGNTGTTFDSISTADLGEKRIPFPPLDVQLQIVSECKAVNIEVEQAQLAIEQAKAEIEKEIVDIAQKGYPTKKIDEISIVNPSKKEITDTANETIVSFIEMDSVSDEGYIAHKVDRPRKDLRKGSYTYFKENDIILAKITPSMENGKCAVARGLTNGIGMGSSEFHVIRTDKAIALPEYVFAFLNREIVRKEAESKMTGASGHRRVPATFYEQFLIPVPQDIQVQENLIAKIEALKATINKSQQVIEGSAERKRDILKRYL
jgi:type I restriction enzyme M protein